MRTTITLDPDISRELKKKMKELDLTFKDAVNRYLRDGLKASNQKNSLKKIALPTPQKLEMKPGISCENIWQLIEDLDG
jgi:hypothetical protein